MLAATPQLSIMRGAAFPPAAYLLLDAATSLHYPSGAGLFAARTIFSAPTTSQQHQTEPNTNTPSPYPKDIREQVKHMFSTPIKKTIAATEVLVAAPTAFYDKLPPNIQHILSMMGRPSLLQRSVTINLQAAWNDHSTKLIGGGGLLLSLSLWRFIHTSSELSSMLSTLSTPWYITEPTTAAVLVYGTYLGGRAYFQRRLTLDPNQVFSSTLKQLNAHPGIREIMGGPVAGGDIRACMSSGGKVVLKHSYKPHFQPPRLHLVFPLSGAERRGLVALEAIKYRGKTHVPLLVIDCPLPAALGGEQRIYLAGGPASHAANTVLEELRRPLLQSLTLEEDEALQKEEESRKYESTIVLNGSKEGNKKEEGGMYIYEKAYFKVKSWLDNLGRKV